MLNFCRSTNEPLFLYILQYTLGPTPQADRFSVLFPAGESMSNPTISKFCFPMRKVTLSNPENDRFMFCLNSKETAPLYGYVIYVELNRHINSFCLISNFFDTRRLFPMLDHFIDLYIKKDTNGCLEYCKRNIRPLPNLASEQNMIDQQVISLFSLLDPYFVGTLIASFVLDCRIIVLSKDTNRISQFCFALLSLFHPLPWPGVFIPVLPETLTDTLLAPFPYIIGLQSAYASIVHSPDMESYVLFNIDVPIVSTIKMAQFPQPVFTAIMGFATKAKTILSSPFALEHAAHELVLAIIGQGVNVPPSKPARMLKKWEDLRHKTSGIDDFTMQVCSSQVVLQVMRAIETSDTSELYKVYFTKPSTRDSRAGTVMPSQPPPPPKKPVVYHSEKPHPSRALPTTQPTILQDISALAVQFNRRPQSIDAMLQQQREVKQRIRSESQILEPEKLGFAAKRALYNNSSGSSDNLTAPKRPIPNRAPKRPDPHPSILSRK